MNTETYQTPMEVVVYQLHTFSISFFSSLLEGDVVSDKLDNSASGASVVALDNKIEQAMVSSITASLLSSALAAAYVTRNRSKGIGARVLPGPILIGDLRVQLAGYSVFTPPSQGFTAASGFLLNGARGEL